MISAEDGRQRFGERISRGGSLIGERNASLIRLHCESVGIGPRLGKSQVDELEHRLKVLARGVAAQALIQFVYVRIDGRNLAREDLRQINGIELAYTAGADKVYSRTGRN